MAALTIAPASVAYISGPSLPDQVAGEAFNAGASLYQGDTGYWFKAQADGTAVEAGANNTGIALATADGAGARVTIALPGATVSVGAGVAGVVYVIGAVAGQLVPVADMVATNKVTPVALGIGSNKLQLMRTYSATSIL